MNIRYFLLVLLFLTIHISAFSQITFSKSIIFPESNDYSTEAVEFDNHYYVSSLSLCFTDSSVNSCFYIIKTDLSGEEVWSRKFEDVDLGLHAGNAESITVLQNNTLLIGASTYSEEDIQQPILINMTLDGDIIWTKIIETEYHEIFWEFKLLPDGNVLTFGTAFNSDGNVILVITNININGEILWRKEIITDCSAELPTNLSWVDDKHLLIGHYCRTGLLDYYPMATKIDTSGNEIWTDYYEDLTTDFTLNIRQGVVQPLPDGGYSFPWATPPNFFSFVTTIMGFDANHQPTWELPLPQINNDTQTELYWMDRTANGDLIWTGSLLGYNGISQYINCIGRLSPTGESKWIRYYLHTDRPWDFFNKFYYITETSDGGLLATGLRNDKYESDTTQTEGNIWLFKVDADGCMTPGCTDETIYLMNDTAFVDTQEARFNEEKHFLLTPNPANYETQVKFVTSASTKNKTLKIFSINGHLMQQEELDGSNQTVKVDLVGFPSGIYVVALEQDGQVLQRERLIKR